jgi:hypothetical protein
MVQRFLEGDEVMNMKKLLFVILMVLVTTPCFAVTSWFACAATQNINAGNEWSSTPSGTCTCTAGSYLTWDTQIAGDSFYANGCTSLAINVDPQGTGAGKGTVLLSTEDGDGAGAGVAGGGFTYATATAITMTMDVVAGTTTALVITGSNAATRTITGNLTGSATTAAKHAVDDNHTVGTIAIGGNATCGTQTTTYGIELSGSGTLTIAGNCVAVGGVGCRVTLSGQLIVAGNCVGSDTVDFAGCHAYGTGGLVTVTGNIIYGLRGGGAYGAVTWAPASAKNFIQTTVGTDAYASAGVGSDAGGTQVTAANTAATISAGTYFVKKDDGVYTQGSATAGGGTTAYGF